MSPEKWRYRQVNRRGALGTIPLLLASSAACYYSGQRFIRFIQEQETSNESDGQTASSQQKIGRHQLEQDISRLSKEIIKNEYGPIISQLLSAQNFLSALGEELYETQGAEKYQEAGIFLTEDTSVNRRIGNILSFDEHLQIPRFWDHIGQLCNGINAGVTTEIETLAEQRQASIRVELKEARANGIIEGLRFRSGQELFAQALDVRTMHSIATSHRTLYTDLGPDTWPGLQESTKEGINQWINSVRAQALTSQIINLDQLAHFAHLSNPFSHQLPAELITAP
jgi:hypothetical protein